MSVSTLGRLLIGSGGVPPVASYGAGAVGAGLPIPPGAVAATPANLESLINSNGSGTDFALGNGRYIGTFSNKTRNGYYGDPNDYTAVVFDGEITYDKVTVGGVKTGGADQIFVGIFTANVFANFTVEKYGSEDNSGGAGPWTQGGAGCLWRNLLVQDCFHSGLQLGGQSHQVRWCTFQFMGRYGANGSGQFSNFYNCDTLSNADDNMEARGLTPRPGTGFDPGGVGIGKFVHTIQMGHHNCRFRDQQGVGGKGLWFDINNSDMVVEDCTFQDIDRFGVDFELSHGGTIRRNTFREVNSRTGSTPWRAGAIHIATGGPAIIEDNDIENVVQSTRSGIMLWQHNRDTEGDNQNPQYWSAMCGTEIRRNRIEGFHYPVGVTCSYTKDGCNWLTNPGDIIIEDNDESDFVEYYRNGEKTAGEWAALGYS